MNLEYSEINQTIFCFNTTILSYETLIKESKNTNLIEDAKRQIKLLTPIRNKYSKELKDFLTY